MEIHSVESHVVAWKENKLKESKIILKPKSLGVSTEKCDLPLYYERVLAKRLESAIQCGDRVAVNVISQELLRSQMDRLMKEKEALAANP